MYTLIDSHEDLMFLNQELINRPYVAVDTEFRRTHKGEVERIKNNPCVFAAAGFGEVQGIDDFAATQDCCRSKIRRRPAYEYAHQNNPWMYFGFLFLDQANADQL